LSEPDGSPPLGRDPALDVLRQHIRTRMREQRAALPPAARMQAAEAIATHLLSDPAFGPGYVAGYWAMGGELPLHVLQMRLRPDQVWCLPCLEPGGRLRFAPWRPGDLLLPNRFGIPEPAVAPSSRLAPEDMAVVLLPLVAFSPTGDRLGMGGGYYDRSFAFRRQAPAPPRLVGVGYGFQRRETLPAESWDVPLDAVVTEDGLLACRA
jgi:5-formyltetrahydrofolate cyclo-ligase